ncbi:MAG: tetratricopeptide repeat protein [Ferruginibacter sp.]|nr:tetratricopeptide repeat protein [Ferruginibacter sp.]
MRHISVNLLLTILLCSFLGLNGFSQPNWTLDPFGKEKKPEKYEEKMLGSEKTATKKFTPFRHFIQNNITRYNYYFNANTKLNEVIERAKLSNTDNYTELLAFYPYSLDNTASQQIELDSVIYKSTAGILLHDLRNDWIDNLYLLIGKSYFLRKELDSAALTFQFINYNLFPRKKGEFENRVVGGREQQNATKSNAFSIADKENPNVLQKVFSKRPSRNESLIWLARTFIEQEKYGESAGLINILQLDPNLPKRLQNDLNVVEAYWFYMQKRYDSSAVYLEKGLSAATNKQDLARWEYLLGQMYELSGQYDKASFYYAKVSKHTGDPVLDIYARLNDAKMLREADNVEELKQSVVRLQRMAKRDKYESYRDLIYYSIGNISLQIPDTVSAIDGFTKSSRSSANTEGFHSKSFFQLGNIAYKQRDYKSAVNYYDSVKISDTLLLDEHDFDFNQRMISLRKLVAELVIIERQDSLQMIAMMEPEAQEEFIRKVLKAEQKKQNQKDAEKELDSKGSKGQKALDNAKTGKGDLFGAPSKGDWYFNNASMRARGYDEFISTWGKRDNIDNWRRVKSAMGMDNKGMIPQSVRDSLEKANANENNFTFEGMLQNVPLTPQQLDSSNNIVAQSIFNIARIFQFELFDYEQAVNMYELYLQRFPKKLRDGEVYMGMYYCYNKLGDAVRADHYKKLLDSEFGDSESALKINNPELFDPNRIDPLATQRYEDIYNLFIEGRFEDAMNLKRNADSLYGTNYWTPQLLYIEAVHYIQQREDSMAIVKLNSILTLYPGSALSDKVTLLIDVLGRRKEIEDYLTKLEITRVEDNKVLVPQTEEKEKSITPTAVMPQPIAPLMPLVKGMDSTIVALPNSTDGVFTLNERGPHYVIMVLNKVDGTYQNEARNAFLRYNREVFFAKGYTITREGLDGDNGILITGVFTDAGDALNYFEKLKKAAPREISWLPANKYYFLIISEDNLTLLRDNKNLTGYRKLLNSFYENRF